MGREAAIRPLVAGNWKMNGLRASLAEARAIRTALETGDVGGNVDLMLCPPATLIAQMAEISAGSALLVGGQDCHQAASGAHTGDISPDMLKDAGCAAVILGHSERRADHGELDRMVRSKAEAAHRAGLITIVCVGETEGQRRAGLTLDVVARQLGGSLPDVASAANTVVAYEPVWAIGTGLTPTELDVAEVHAHMRKLLTTRLKAEGENMRLLYGGSVRPSNAGALMAVENVNGALVGGASLTATDFLGIAAAYA
ncbi:MAG: hypothetical protein RLZ98_2149 [Pseudomonadota bacterium]|jgi:triosephosphate isomerase